MCSGETVEGKEISDYRAFFKTKFSKWPVFQMAKSGLQQPKNNDLGKHVLVSIEARVTDRDEILNYRNIVYSTSKTPIQDSNHENSRRYEKVH